MKIGKTIAVVILLTLVAGGVYLYLNYSNLLKNQVEKIASQALNVDVSIASLKLSLSDKSVTIKGLSIANPPGYKKSKAVTIGSISVSLAEIPENLELIKFKNIDVADVNVNMEVTQSATNLTDLKNGIKKSETSSNTAQPKVTLQKFYINQSSLNPTITLIGGDLKTVTVPPVTLTGIGTKENGILAKDAIQQIVTQYLNIATSKAQSAGYLEGLSGISVEDVKAQAKEKINSEIKNRLGNILGN